MHLLSSNYLFTLLDANPATTPASDVDSYMPDDFSSLPDLVSVSSLPVPPPSLSIPTG